MGRSGERGSGRRRGTSPPVEVINKGPWTESEDEVLSAYIKAHGEGNWRLIPKLAGLARCGKSCRLRWINYLRPDLKRGNFSSDEDNLILTLHALLGNKWSLIAGRIPGRTDNEIKNYWNTHLKRRLRGMGIDPMSYQVGLTLLPLIPNPAEQDPHLKRPQMSSSSTSSEDLPTVTAHHVKANANHLDQLLLHADKRQRRLSSPETSSSTSSGNRWTSASELDSNSISQGERVVAYQDLPFSSSTPSYVPGHEEPSCAGSDCFLQPPETVVMSSSSSESLPALCPAAENFHCVPSRSAATWEYHDLYGMHTHLLLLDQTAALNLESLDCFESDLLPTETSQLQNEAQMSIPWGSLGLFDPIL